ncbi:MAG: cyclase [Myxococcales bacterium]|nr:cyclase [Myxococcales bacterium]
MSTSFPRGVLVGALATYFFDPGHGRIRRSKVRDQGTHLTRVLRRFLGKSTSDAEHRIHGAVERFEGTARTDAGDHVIAERVRAHLGHVIGYASAIDIRVEDHVVTLSGPVLESEVSEVMRCVRAIPGVRDVVDQLERHATADTPALQSELTRRRGEQWAPAIQGVAIVGGSALVGWGFERRGLLGSLLAATGVGLLLRAGVNKPLRTVGRRLIGREGIEIEKTITVHAPVENVFDLWERFENFPKFMEHVREVEVDIDHDPLRSRWVVDGPWRMPVTFEAITTHVDRLKVIAWATVPNQPIEHTGVVKFESVPEGTRVQLRMTYRPPGGLISHGVARLLHSDPKARMNEDLVRMKSLLEDGRTRAHGERVEIRDLAH